ncbi:hypothetical protein J6590_105346 [Homalodisca vitripennis]|nr:hypothetical protein J6590_105346 [Homalodisca vitripennis]
MSNRSSANSNPYSRMKPGQVLKAVESCTAFLSIISNHYIVTPSGSDCDSLVQGELTARCVPDQVHGGGCKRSRVPDGVHVVVNVVNTGHCLQLVLKKLATLFKKNTRSCNQTE